MKTTTVKNVLTEQVETYYNNLSIKDNLVTSVLTANKMNSQLHNEDARQKASKGIERLSTKKGNEAYYYQELDLIAYCEY